MSTDTHQRPETADEYGRYEKIFHNHRRAPFRLRDHIESIQKTCLNPDPDGFLSEAGILPAHIPDPHIGLELDQDPDHAPTEMRSSLLDLSDDEVPRLPASPLDELKFSPELLDLGSCQSMDLQSYLELIRTKNSINWLSQWLPLIPTRVEKDEGLPFPTVTTKLWSLMRHEIEREGIPSSHGLGSQEVEDECEDQVGAAFSLNRHDLTMTRRWPTASHQISPPLSPVSDDSVEPYVPKEKASIIDLTSEPSSPINTRVEKLQRAMETGCIESEPLEPPDLGMLSSPKQHPQYPVTIERTRELKVDAPIMLMSSDDPEEITLFRDPGVLSPIESTDSPEAVEVVESHFTEAFADILKQRHSDVMLSINQERLDPFDSVSRLSVPILDFQIPDPEWSEHQSSPKHHFSWLQSSLRAFGGVCIHKGVPHLSSTVKWEPVPPGKGRIVIDESPPQVELKTHYLLSLDEDPATESASYTHQTHNLSILHLGEEEEIDELDFLDTGAEISRTTDPGEVSESVISGQEIATHKPPFLCSIKMSPYTLPKSSFCSNNVLPGSHDTNAVATLLSSFMELRAAKKPRLEETARASFNATPDHRGDAKATGTTPLHKQSTTLPSSMTRVPEALTPTEKGCYIVSVGLRRSLLRSIGKEWPAELLIDRDFSRLHYTSVCSAGTAAEAMPSQIVPEADIALTSTAGIIVTTLLQVRQRPLPGSKTQSPLRERIQALCHKYECLMILVSECNAAGEISGNQTPADMAAYADMVRYTAALKGTIIPYFIPGANETLAKWIVSIMCQYSLQSTLSKDLLSIQETTWEIFFRRVGMNVIRAQILSTVLRQEAGHDGLAQFIAMPVQQRISRYEGVLGGTQALLSASAILDQTWT